MGYVRVGGDSARSQIVAQHGYRSGIAQFQDFKENAFEYRCVGGALMHIKRIADQFALAAISIGMQSHAQEMRTPSGQSHPVETSMNRQAQIDLRAGYRDFIFGHGMEDEQYMDAIRAGKNPSVPRASYAEGIHTSEGAEEGIHSVIFAAYKSMRANNDHYQHDMNLLTGKGYSPEDVAKMDALGEQRVEKENAIVEQAIAQLRNLLTDEDFRRMDWYVRTLERIGK